MYWGQRWNGNDGVWQGTASADGDAGKQVLDAVLQKSEGAPSNGTGRPAYIMFPTPAFESRFKSCLAGVPVECHLEQEGRKRFVALRPRNLAKFDDLIRSSGLGNCDAATRAVKWLRSNPTEFLRFETN